MCTLNQTCSIHFVPFLLHHLHVQKQLDFFRSLFLNQSRVPVNLNNQPTFDAIQNQHWYSQLRGWLVIETVQPMRQLLFKTKFAICCIFLIPLRIFAFRSGLGFSKVQYPACISLVVFLPAFLCFFICSGTRIIP